MEDNGSAGGGKHKIKLKVEECRHLPIRPYWSAIKDLETRAGTISHSPSWNSIDLPPANIRVNIKSDGLGEIRAWLDYQMTIKQQKTQFSYGVGLVSTHLFGGTTLRWWWVCPQCGRRAGLLYLPPGETRFLCRRCHHLTYLGILENQENYVLVNLLLPIWANKAADAFPDLTFQEIGQVLDCQMVGKRIPRKLAARLEVARAAQMAEPLTSLPDPHADYLSEDELCGRAGLSRDDLTALKTARLLVPDHSGKYRPKLASWAKKLAYLIQHGWGIEQIKNWSTDRWESGNPGQWPPI